MRIPKTNSIANRIKWAYAVIFIIVLIGLFMQWIDLSRLEWQLEVSKATAELMDSIREIRRYEKNWFLYKNRTDLISAEGAIEHTFSLIEKYEDRYSEMSSPGLLDRLRQKLGEYRILIRPIRENGNDADASIQRRIRISGHELTDLAQRFQKEEQAIITRKIDLMTMNGLLSGALAFLVIFILGRQLIRSVVKPLNEIVEYSHQVSDEEYHYGWRESNIEEIRSVIQSLNVMVKRIKERERQIIQNAKMATLGTLVAGIAHELNNPLSNISTSAEILNEEMHQESGNTEILNEMVSRIIDQSDRAKRIVRSLLEFSREKEMLIEKISVKDLIYEVKNLVQGKLDPKIVFSLNVENDGTFFADRQRIQQVLINLILNAIQAVNESGSILLKGNYNRVNNQVYLEVSDDGCGIEKEDLNRIFDPFFTTKDIGEGSGLGLAVSREIIEKHSGTIHVQSSRGKGSTFIISLPGVEA